MSDFNKAKKHWTSKYEVLSMMAKHAFEELIPLSTTLNHLPSISAHKSSGGSNIIFRGNTSKKSTFTFSLR